jgi:chloramphenicol 3-O phosphotransferase
MVVPGQVVVLNGTSSAGKSSTAAAFQAARAADGDCWIVTGLDDYLAKLPGEWVEVGAWIGARANEGIRLETDGDRAMFRLGELARRLMRAYRRSVRELARAGLNVMVDEVSLQEDEWLDWCEALQGLDPVWVAVRCDVEVAVAREAARGDRAIGLVRGQADVVHRFPDYRIELDTTASSVAEIVEQLDHLLALRPVTPAGDARRSPR